MLEPPSAFGGNIWATPFYCFEFYMGCRSVLLPIPPILPMGRLWVEHAQVCHVPRVYHVFVGLRVLQHVCASSYDLRDYEGSFPLRGKFCTFSCICSKTRSPLRKVLV